MFDIDQIAEEAVTSNDASLAALSRNYIEAKNALIEYLNN